MVRSWISACLCTVTLFIADGKAQTSLDSGANSYLKGINAVQYSTYFESQLAGPRCEIDKNNWAIALKFVANQSAKLKFIPEDEYRARLTELSNRASSLVSGAAASEPGREKYDAAQKELRDYGQIPRLRITVTAIELGSGCAGSLEGKLSVKLAPTSIIATKVMVFNATEEIWSEGQILKSPHKSFSAFAISNGERLIKKLVNDWTDSQF